MDRYDRCTWTIKLCTKYQFLLCHSAAVFLSYIALVGNIWALNKRSYYWGHRGLSTRVVLSQGSTTHYTTHTDQSDTLPFLAMVRVSLVPCIYSKNLVCRSVAHCWTVWWGWPWWTEKYNSYWWDTSIKHGKFAVTHIYIRYSWEYMALFW